MEFTIKDQYLIKCSQINKKYEANRFLKMFLTNDRVLTG